MWCNQCQRKTPSVAGTAAPGELVCMGCGKTKEAYRPIVLEPQSPLKNSKPAAGTNEDKRPAVVKSADKQQAPKKPIVAKPALPEVAPAVPVAVTQPVAEQIRVTASVAPPSAAPLSSTRKHFGSFQKKARWPWRSSSCGGNSIRYDELGITHRHWDLLSHRSTTLSGNPMTVMQGRGDSIPRMNACSQNWMRSRVNPRPKVQA